MRIDNSLLIAGENRTDTGDLMSRLETGDVIKAKVLESSPQEAVLRLSDGSVIKARVSESLDVKPGQTILLSVTSRTENSFVLETIKGVSRTIPADTEKLQKMLEAAGIKLNNTNINLAAEFLKYNAAPTAENITKALELMKGPDGLDAEKAVYLSVKDINSGQADKDMLSGILSGSLKLGKLLESLHKALNSEVINNDDQNTEAGSAASVASKHSSVIDNKSAQQMEHPSSEASDNQSNVSSSASDTQSKAVNAHSAISPKTGTDTAGQNAPAASANGSTVGSSGLQKSEIKTETNNEPKDNHKAGLNTVPKTELNAIADANEVQNALTDAVHKESGEDRAFQKSASLKESAFAPKSDVNITAGHANTLGIAKESQGISTKAAVEKNLPEQTIKRITNSIEKLYVKINKQLSADELDSGNIKHRLSELSKELNLLTQSSTGSRAVNKQAASALNTVEDTVRLLDMFNSNNVLYYQIPVKIDTYRSTAELYVMKRNQNKKRIDPNDSVLFLSLDTKNMGRIETLLDVKGRNISISLRTESQAVSDFAKENIKDLYTGLSECGYKLADMRYSIIGAASTPVQQEKLLADAVRLKHGKVDFRI